MVRRRRFETAVVIASLFLCGCDPPPHKAEARPAASVENRVKENDLTRVTLASEAEKRLGIEVVPIMEQQSSSQMRVAGDVVAIPGKTVIVAAPASGVVTLASPKIAVGQTVRYGQPLFRLVPMLTPQRDLRTTYEADVVAAKARFDAAQKQLDRAKQLLRDLAGSRRNVEIADQEFAQAKASYDAAQERLNRLDTHPLEADIEMSIAAPLDGMLRQILAAEGQNVTAGGALFELADLRKVWLRVPVYSADMKAVGAAATVTIRDIDGKGPIREGKRIDAFPTADPLAVTSDIYYELSNPNLDLRLGQRLSATLPLRTAGQKRLSVPLSAILYDVHGGTWIYLEDGPHIYRRQRVELAESNSTTAFLSRGVIPGMKVVTQGATELFGTEFGVGH